MTRMVSHMDERIIQIGHSRFPYLFGEDCLDEIGHRLKQYGADRFFVVTDDTVFGLYGEALLDSIGLGTPVTVLSHPPGESMKTLSCMSEHIENAIAAGASRRSVVVSLGGGIPGNLAGLIASLIYRGIRLVHIPTTTIAAMDSVLSLKQAINSRVGKNHIGCYYTPQAIMTDVLLFRSLSGRELRSGLCEMAKNCLAIDPAAVPGLRMALEARNLSSPSTLLWLLDASMQAKSMVTADDTYERGAGLVLEYGHTVGHAIELADHRRRGAAGISHGESIAIGMLVAARISHARGLLPAEDLETHDTLIGALGVGTEILKEIPVAEIIEVVRDDNKRGYLPVAKDSTPFVLLEELGKPLRTDNLPLVSVTLDEIADCLDELVYSSPSQHLQLGNTAGSLS
ncbi:2-deoxy-scyllo-inosose synthase [Nocardia abscessus]|uniref:2-deoxy-scyllo-inosose synthase n=2 Tax=Nocardia abscessus TaxID=120957 RepID=UPI0027E0A4C2|nr:2-deoxy-scyllo-inosose synthase [Nocardia abscessus]